MAADRYVDDGGTDDGDCTVQASPCGTIAYALSQASGGDTVHVDAGTYSTSGLSYAGDITLQGAGTASPRSLLKGTSADVFHFESASGTVAIQGFAIENAGGEAFSFGLAGDSATFQLSDVDATLSGGQSYAGVYVYAAPGESVTLQVTNADFADYQTGVLGYASYAEALDVTLTNTTSTGSSLEGLYLSASGNTADVATEQPDLSVHIGTSHLAADGNNAVELYGNTLGGFDLTLTDNTFSASNYDAFRVDLGDIRAPSIEATVTGNTFKSTSEGDGLQLSASPAVSFDAVVDIRDNTFEASSTGAYLYVPDVGAGSLTFQNNTLEGNGGNGATLYMWGNDASDSTLDLVCQQNTATGNDSHGIYIEVSSAAIATISVLDNTLANNGSDGLNLDFSGTGADSHYDVTIADNDLQDNGDDGLDLNLSSYGQGSLTVSGNTAAGNESDQLYLFIDNTSDAPGFLDLQVRDNTADGTLEATDVVSGRGIEINAYGYNTILGNVSGNTVTNAGESGLVFWATDYTNLVDVTLSDNTLTGNDIGLDIGITDSTYNAVHLDVVGNTITGNVDDGVRIRNTYDESNNLVVDLRSNDISDNGGDGVEIENSYGSFTGRFYGNLIRGNDQNGVYVSSASDDGFFLKLTHNTISGNADGYADSDYYDVDASGMDYYDMLAFENWWGTEDTATIETHIYDWNDTDDIGEVLYSALSADLAFDLAAPSGPEAGGTQILIRATDDVTRFVPSVPGHPLTVTFGDQAAIDLTVSNDGKWLWATIPAHAPGVVTVTVTLPGDQTGTASFEYLAAFVDADEDGVEDSVDNCLGLANPEQGDFDGDDAGDACDPDDDGDGVADTADNCVLVANPGQGDLDEDDIGDACDPDADGDGVSDAEDNCLGVDNPGQADGDDDGIGDDCDIDANGDGIADVDQIAEEGGSCGCATPASTPAPGWVLLGMLGLFRRRRRSR